MSQKVCLLILDGFGINESTPSENAITQASPTPTFDRLFSTPRYTRLEASGRAVGIPDGFMGGSEVGHLTIGAGRVIPQAILEISDLLDSWAFAQIPEYQAMVDYLHSTGKTLHIASMLGYEGVHSYQKHLHSLLDLLPSDISVSLHLFSDGRDSPIMSSEWYLSDLLQIIAGKPHIQITSLSGRYYAMDRDNNESRIEKAFSAMLGQCPTDLAPREVFEKSYAEKVYDEFIEPVSFSGKHFLSSGDVFLHMHYRSDRGSQLVRRVEKLEWVETYTMTRFSDDLRAKYFIRRKPIEQTLSEILSTHGKTQLHLAETEKFAHVTKFFNGLRSGELKGEKHILIPSHKVKSYTEDPTMSAQEILEVFDREGGHYDFSVVNLANGDMVGHTGDLDSAKQAVETLDRVTAQFIEICHREGINLMITADHGNCETMGTPESPMTSHTTNLVPFWHISHGEVVSTRPTGGLASIAPTILEVMGIERGKDMSEGLLL